MWVMTRKQLRLDSTDPFLGLFTLGVSAPISCLIGGAGNVPFFFSPFSHTLILLYKIPFLINFTIIYIVSDRESYSSERQRVTRECNQQSSLLSWQARVSSHTDTQVRLGRQDPEPL
jgi:hypothetical protein